MAYQECTGCPLKGRPELKPNLSRDSDILFVFGDPEEDACLEGKIYTERTEAFLSEHLSQLDNKLTFSFTSVLKCYPQSGLKPGVKARARCKDILMAEVKLTNPRLIVAFGKSATAILTGETAVKKLNGRILWETPTGIPTAVCISPLYVLHTGDKDLFQTGFLPIAAFFEAVPEINMELVDTLLPNPDCPYAVDLETKWVAEKKDRPARPHEGVAVSMGVSNIEETAFTHDVFQKDFLEQTPLIVHNAQHEHGWFLSKGINANIVHDTKLLAYLLDQRLSLRLEALCLKFGVDKSYKTDVTQLEGANLDERGGRDAYNTAKLAEILYPQLSEEETKVYHDVLIPAMKAVAQIELEGIRVDVEKKQAVTARVEADIQALDLANDGYLLAFNANSSKPFNVKSPVHKKLLVYDILGYTPPNMRIAKTESGGFSTGKDVLSYLLSQRYTPTLEKLIKYSEYSGWKSSFLEALDQHIITQGDVSKVYTSLWIGDTSTGRIKSNKPNMQNSPKTYVREIFIPTADNGLFLEFDYDAIEFKVLAALSGDEAMLEALESGDPHLYMARLIWPDKKLTKESKEREIAKKINFGVPFGGTPSRVAMETGLQVREAKKFFDIFWKTHPTLEEYYSSFPAEGWVYSPTGMKRWVNSIREAKNFPPQNTALIILLRALNELVWEVKRQGAAVNLTIHDSVLIDLPTQEYKRIAGVAKEILESVTFDWMPFKLTVSAKIGPNWGAMVPVKI